MSEETNENTQEDTEIDMDLDNQPSLDEEPDPNGTGAEPDTSEELGAASTTAESEQEEEPEHEDDLVQYIGTKITHAEKMDLDTYNKTFDRNVPDRNGKAGFTVVYGLGTDREYRSWSPKQEFMAAYRPTDRLSFGLALDGIRAGYKARRAGWNGRGIFVQLQRPDENSKMTSEYIYIDTTGLETENKAAPKSCVPWLASQTDILADDWEIFE